MSEISKVPDLFEGGRPLNPSDSGYKDAVMHILSLDPIDKRVNEMANKSLYVPIQIAEELLDFLFPLGWSFEFRASREIANEIVMDGELVIDCGGIKIKRWGAGAEPIQFVKGANPLDLDKKIVNTLAKDYPNAKAEAFRNACKGLGTVFGRNLNRKEADKATPYSPARVMDSPQYTLLETAPTLADLKAAFESLPPEFKEDPVITKLFMAKKDLFTKKPAIDL